MQDDLYEALTNAQMVEALEACEAILDRWRELTPLSRPLASKRREIEGRLPTRANE